MRSLLADGADPNVLTEGGHTPLILAAISGHTEIVALLLEAGADLRVTDNLGLTALEWSVRRGFANITQLISEAPIQDPSSQKTITPNSVPRRANYHEAGLEAASQGETPQTPTANEPGINPVEPESAKASLGGAAAAILRTRAKVVTEPGAQRLHSQADDDTERPPESVAVDLASVPTEISSDATAKETGASSNLPAPTETLTSTTNEKHATETTQSRTLIQHLHEEARKRKQVHDASQQQELFAAEAEAVAVSLPAPVSVVSAALDRSEAKVSKAPSSAARAAARPIRTGHNRRSPSRKGRPSLMFAGILVLLVGSASVAYLFRNRLFIAEQEPPVSSAPSYSATPTSQPTALTVKKNLPVVDGELIGAEVNLPDPAYPANVTARTNDGSSPTVMVLVRVNRKGEVTSARALYGDDDLRAAAERAARKATFSPQKLSNKGTVVTGTITYTFIPPGSSPTVTTAPPSLAAGEDSPVVAGPLAGAEINLPAPDYPQSARINHLSGKITIVVRVNRSGRVISWLTLDGDPQLRAAALTAAKKATFSPEKLPGKGDVVGTITYNFRL